MEQNKNENRDATPASPASPYTCASRASRARATQGSGAGDGAGRSFLYRSSSSETGGLGPSRLGCRLGKDTCGKLDLPEIPEPAVEVLRPRQYMSEYSSFSPSLATQTRQPSRVIQERTPSMQTKKNAN